MCAASITDCRRVCNWVCRMPFSFSKIMKHFGVKTMDVEDDKSVEGDPDAEMEAPEEEFVVENPSLDLEMYSSSYSGLMKVERLLFIARHAPSLRVEAYQLALAEIQLSSDIDKYEEVHGKLSEAIRELSLPFDDDCDMMEISLVIPPLDMEWVEQTRKKAERKLHELDLELKRFRDHSIRENIRKGYNKMGRHYQSMGSLKKAHLMYSKAKDYCTGADHTISMCLHLIQVSVYLRNWYMVPPYVSRALTFGNCSDSESDSYDPDLCSKLGCAIGLAAMAEGNYEIAGKKFVQISFDHCEFPELLSSTDVAIYGTLCALATFSRVDLQDLVVLSCTFHHFLAIHPQIRKMVNAFHDSEYSRMLSLMQDVYDDFKLDLYLSPHLERLYELIRRKSMVQYCKPYMAADMRKMAEAFNTSVDDLENELVLLILDQEIQARIDSQAKILYEKKLDPRTVTFEKALRAGESYLRSTKAMLLRAAVLRNNISVQIEKSAAEDEPPVKKFRPCFTGLF